MAFTITPDEGYAVSDIRIDGKRVISSLTQQIRMASGHADFFIPLTAPDTVRIYFRLDLPIDWRK